MKVFHIKVWVHEQLLQSSIFHSKTVFEDYGRLSCQSPLGVAYIVSHCDFLQKYQLSKTIVKKGSKTIQYNVVVKSMIATSWLRSYAW